MVLRTTHHWLAEADMFFEKTGPVWETLHSLQQRLDQAGIEYVLIGGLALNAYGYPRQTTDVDVVLTSDGFKRFASEFTNNGYRQSARLPRRFLDSKTETAVDILIAGQIAGRVEKNPSVRFPDPSEAVLQGDLRTVTLARLIELKLVTWRYKDWGDVVELIRRNQLSESFAEKLDAVARTPFGECFDQASDPNYDSG